MKTFRTVFPDLATDLKINHQTGVCLIGSCFTENIGRKLEDAKFRTLQNPFGILYNPFSIAESLERIIAHRPFGIEELVERNGLWMSFAHHGRFSGLKSDVVLTHINNSLADAHHFLKEAKVLFISLGTSKSYRLKTTQKVVANCHKFPANTFDYSLSGKEEIVQVLTYSIKSLQVFNPNLKIIFTVSPVRHLKDGFMENQRSKATLLLSVADLQYEFGQVNYFPSYEIMMDDLRDYRFYASDLVHPSQEAIDYIFDRFEESYFDDLTISLMKRIAKIKNAINHQPFNEQSPEYQLFVQSILIKIKALEQEFPFLNFDAEKTILQGRI